MQQLLSESATAVHEQQTVSFRFASHFIIIWMGFVGENRLVLKKLKYKFTLE